MFAISTISNFILSEWIWGVTLGLYHIPCNIIAMIILFKFFLRINIVPAVFLSLGANLFSFAIFTLITLITMIIIGHGNGPTSFDYIPNPMHAFVFLGIIYALLQSLFFKLISHRRGLQLSWFVAITFISNNLTVLLCYLFIAVD